MSRVRSPLPQYNPSGGMVDTMDLKFIPLLGLGSSPRMGSRYGGMVDTADLGSVGFTLYKFKSCYL